ncbi:MAG: hypothetical protein M1828_001237 [Chrysothrix sp. TS-e1954]|nr:MAG: hypothetical protein M1828_001237 [Chrysothrix sp. TS-e1954]
MDHTQQAVQSFAAVEKQLSLQLAKDDGEEECLLLLEKLRGHCTAAISRDVEAFSAAHVEERLWGLHQKLNASYRAKIHKLKVEGAKKAVELRKLSTGYLRFIKASQRYYRTFISDLSLAHGSVPKLEAIASKLNRQASNSDSKIASHVTEIVATDICYRTLIQLGDLSRYREAELGGKPQDWSHAIQFYDLAMVLCPSSGIANNQLSLIALSEGNLLSAVYHLYRSLTSAAPHPQAEGNLRKAFYKISGRWDKRDTEAAQSVKDSYEGHSLLAALQLRLLAKCYHGRVLVEYDEVERHLSAQLATCLQDSSLDAPLLQRIVLTAMAACWVAQERFQHQGGSLEAMQSFVYLLRLNIDLFTTILQSMFIQLSEFLRIQCSQDVLILAEQMSSSLQALLVLLRLYSSWLMKNTAVMTNDVHPLVDTIKDDFWSQYISCLSLIAHRFPVRLLPHHNILLQEDLDTRGSRALTCEDMGDDGHSEGQLELELRDQANLQLSSCVLGRIRSILLQGRALALNDNTPFVFHESTGSFTSDRATVSNVFDVSETLVAHPADSSTAITDEADEAGRMVLSLVQDDDDGVNMASSASFPKAEASVETPLSRENARGSANRLSGSSSSHIPVSPQTGFLPRSKLSRTSLVSVQNDALTSRPSTCSREVSPSEAASSPHLHQTSTRYGLDTAKQLSGFPRLSGGGHHRTYSNESMRSVGSIWSPSQETWSRYRATNAGSESPRSASLALGNGTFGVLDDGNGNPAGSPSQNRGGINSAWVTTKSEAEQRFRASPNILLDRAKG